jgi:hypothetical protein
MFSTDPAVLDALREKGCLLPDESVNRDAVVALVAAELEAGHIVAAADDIAALAATPGTLAADIFGVHSPDLAKLVGTLTSPTDKGKVQRALSDGYYLCGGRVKVTVEVAPGEYRTVSVAVRFLSADGEMIRHYALDRVAKRALSAARAAAATGALVKQRQPTMAADVDAWYNQLHLTFQAELMPGTAE